MDELSQVQRIFELVKILNNTTGLTREEIFSRIHYGKEEGKGKEKKLERDLNLIEDIGFKVEKVRGNSNREKYSIVHAERFFIQIQDLGKKTKLAFGIHIGKEIEELPLDYLIWMAKKEIIIEGINYSKLAIDLLKEQGHIQDGGFVS